MPRSIAPEPAAALRRDRQRAEAPPRHSRSLAFPLPPALDAERLGITVQGQRVALYQSLPWPGQPSSPSPMLLVHSVNAAASAAEVRPVFQRYAGTRPVVALELPGFGSSKRDGWVLTPALMSEAIQRAVGHLREQGFHAPVDLLAVSLSGEFAARAALEMPGAFRSVALVNPTGLESAHAERYQGGRTKDKPWLRWLLEVGPWANPLFRALTGEPSMRKFLERSWGSKHIDETLLAYNLQTVRQAGARHAPYAFIAGALFTRGVAQLYAQLPQPVWLAHGTRGEFNKFDGVARLGPPSHWTVDRFDTGAMPYFERPGDFGDRYDAFLQMSSLKGNSAC